MSIATNEQILTALGLFGGICGAFYSPNFISTENLAIGFVGFGSGIAGANAVTRTAELLKNGRAENNGFGKGARAGLSIFCALAGLRAIPQMHKVLNGGKSEGVWMLLGLGALVGIVHNGDVMWRFLKGNNNYN